ncbi:hypothetical protein [Methanoplanus limicola]|uniref:Uncharacterized protein n=1 Tax=Methanoplanus limicola DSM 2279 TaxID=937775 RepID=H1Z3G3_9EURY|nr:hypothetical protein [Methanoplanus limicola]EHQ34758.1 hypothetical protein Metlim_0633 [Methanoplanus limicola DSM 2279]
MYCDKYKKSTFFYQQIKRGSSPDGHTFGYYYDNSDGSNDGRIQFNINNPDGIARGTWRYEVYGYDVSGTEDYTI